MKIVVDTYAWIEIFIGSPKGDRARKILAETREVYTPDVVLAEVARKYFRERIEQEVIFERLNKISEASSVVPIDPEVAVEAARCYEELSEKARKGGVRAPSLFDAIVLGVARVLKAKVVTGDEHLKGLPQTFWLD